MPPKHHKPKRGRMRTAMDATAGAVWNQRAKIIGGFIVAVIIGIATALPNIISALKDTQAAVTDAPRQAQKISDQHADLNDLYSMLYAQQATNQSLQRQIDALKRVEK